MEIVWKEKRAPKATFGTLPFGGVSETKDRIEKLLESTGMSKMTARGTPKTI